MNGNDTNTKGNEMTAREINDARIQIALLNDEHSYLSRADRTADTEDAGEIATRLAEIREERDRLQELVG